MFIYLAIQVLCDPGDIVLVDRPSYFVFLEMLAGLGVQARSLPTAPDGSLDVPALEALLAELRRSGDGERVRAVYFVSYFSNPSARSMAETEKIALASALDAFGFHVPVLEDAAYRELFFLNPPGARSVLSLEAWQRFPRLYLSTLTKPFATGLKVGYATCSDEAWLKKMLHVKGHHDFGTANYNQALLERAIESGRYDQHLLRLRPAYHRKMQALHEALQEAGLPQLGWHWDRPEGGLYLWLEGPVGINTGLEGDFCRACITEGVVYVPGDLCFGDAAPTNRVRLSFGVLDEGKLREAARRFARAARRFGG